MSKEKRSYSCYSPKNKDNKNELSFDKKSYLSKSFNSDDSKSVSSSSYCSDLRFVKKAFLLPNHDIILN